MKEPEVALQNKLKMDTLQILYHFQYYITQKVNDNSSSRYFYRSLHIAPQGTILKKKRRHTNSTGVQQRLRMCWVVFLQGRVTWTRYKTTWYVGWNNMKIECKQITELCLGYTFEKQYLSLKKEKRCAQMLHTGFPNAFFKYFVSFVLFMFIYRHYKWLLTPISSRNATKHTHNFCCRNDQIYVI